MTDAVIAGGFTVPFTKDSDDITKLGARAVRGLLRQVGLGPDFPLDAVVAGTVHGGSLIGQRILKRMSLTGVPVINVENACATGATAVHVATNMVRAGRATCVLVVTAERLSKLGGGTLPLDRTDLEAAQGSIMPAVYALRASRYLYENGLKPEVLAPVSVKNRANGALNPVARFQEPVTLEQVLDSPMIAEPLTMLQCSPNSDGASAVLVTSREFGRSLDRPLIDVRASIIESGVYSSGPRDLTRPDITLRAVGQAYAEAGLGPADLSFAEVHDAFSIAEPLYYEALGFAERGTGWKFLADGKPYLGGQVPFNPSGGLLSRGHPIGVTGVAQVVEAYEQLTGTAGKRQVDGARVALTHVTGGGISGVDNGACGVHIFAA